VLVGTYHLADDRHAALTTRVAGMMEGATALLVEAGPDEEAALKRDLAANPGLLFLTDGPSLMQQFPPEEWAQMAQALAARNVPAIMAAKMQPWYLASILAIPPCDMPEVTAGLGLDHRVMELAQERNIPIRALEPYTTVFRIFDSMSAEEQLAMLRSSLMMEDRVADFSVTLSDAYFRGESRMVWEFLRQLSGQMPGYTPERADAEFAQMEAVLMTERNRSWIPVIEEAAAKGPVVAAFGALHLAGETGVLNLLTERGWQLERLDG
ncbi:MAG: TraB/GumN family protein, partial [Gemmobacter sp.]